MKKGILVLALVMVCGTTNAWAARTAVHVAAESADYGRKAGGMLGRGLLNVVTCFVDLIVNVVNETKNGPPLVGTLVGIGKGAGCTVLRAGSGVVDVGTFWVPGFNGFPVSDSYENCLVMAPTSGEVSTMFSDTIEPSGASSDMSSSAAESPRKQDKATYTK